MNPLIADAIRASFLNVAQRERKTIPLPDLDAVDWEARAVGRCRGSRTRCCDLFAPLLRRVMARMIGRGFRPEHVDPV